MFTWPSVSTGLELLLVNLASINENSECNIFKDIKLLGKISNNWPNDLFRINAH